VEVITDRLSWEEALLRMEHLTLDLLLLLYHCVSGYLTTSRRRWQSCWKLAEASDLSEDIGTNLRHSATRNLRKTVLLHLADELIIFVESLRARFWSGSLKKKKGKSSNKMRKKQKIGAAKDPEVSHDVDGERMTTLQATMNATVIDVG
jgi:hypothetical protein